MQDVCPTLTTVISRLNTDINSLKIDVTIIVETEVHIPVPQGNISTGFR